MLTGAVLVEVTFALPGIGALLVDSVDYKDVPMVQGLTMVVAATIILVNLATDVVYLFVDPRIRFGSAKRPAGQCFLKSMLRSYPSRRAFRLPPCWKPENGNRRVFAHSRLPSRAIPDLSTGS